jgi:dTDP-4-dehydrorhamnose 3,5-epimerase
MNPKFTVKDTIFKDAKLIIPNIFEDHRGSYIETFNEDAWREIADVHFVQDDISVSHKNILRGIHGDFVTWKLVQCIYGAFFNVIVDRNPSSPTFNKWEGFVLADRERMQLLIPPGFGNGVLALTEPAIYHYKQTTYYQPGRQFTIKWNDPEIGIEWPLKGNPILSERDSFQLYN